MASKTGRWLIVLATTALATVVALFVVLLPRHSRGRQTAGATEDTVVDEGAPASPPRADLPMTTRPRAFANAAPSPAQEPSQTVPGPPDVSRFARTRSAPRLIGNTGSPDRDIIAMSKAFSDRFRSELPAELASQVTTGSLDCFHGGCVMTVDYRGKGEIGTQFERFMMASDAFAIWSGPKMRIENKPGDRSAGETWCFFRSAEAAKALLSED